MRKVCKWEKIENTEKLMKIWEKMKKLGENLTRKACKREKIENYHENLGENLTRKLKIQRNS